MPTKIFNSIAKLSLVQQIIIGLILGIVVALLLPTTAKSFALLGTFFIQALKAVAPVLVAVLVTQSIAQKRHGGKTNIKTILVLYVIGTFFAALTGVIASNLYPITLALATEASSINPPSDLRTVLTTVLLNAVDNPVNALIEANYIGILCWAVIGGLALRQSSDTTQTVLADVANMVSKVVGWVIRLAPIGVFGLVANVVATTGLSQMTSYVELIILLLACMLFVALVINPLIVFLATRQNPYPLVFTCLTQSGITAFFTRSSAANIPVNLTLCEKLGLDKDTYGISIPLGATINMAGSAVTITVMALAAVHTVGGEVSLPMALLLSLIATLGASGASGVPGGSLLLIPMACSIFGLDADVAASVVAIGFIVSVIQDSAETALNSSTDVLFTATADKLNKRHTGTRR